MSQVKIKSFGVLSVAKVQGALMAIFGLIIGVIYGLVFMLFGAAMLTQRGGGGGAAGGIVIGLVAMVGIPIFYGVIGFIGGAIGALVYNAMSGLVGGIEMEIENTNYEYAPPPQPPQWGNQ